MMRLTREVRFALAEADGPVLNTWAGWPSSDCISPFLILRIMVEGGINPNTGYLCNIRDLDQLVRHHAVPYLRGVNRKAEITRAGQLISELWLNLDSKSPPDTRISKIELGLTPFLRYSMMKEFPNMVHLTQSFEFSASHRLYAEQLSEQENQDIFGKCANPNGHGHNYVVEVTVAGRPAHAAQNILALPKFERIVKQRIIDRFDHKHLNLDCPEFSKLNPTVENITRVIWDLLVDQVSPAQLSSIRVWETPKTYAEYRGEE